MPCESYKNALVEAAASGQDLQSDLRTHLASCPSCRSWFAKEQSLFASIDAGIHKNANAEVSSSLLPRVRARLDNEAAVQRGRFRTGAALASAAAIAMVFLMAHLVWRTNVKDSQRGAVARTNPPSSISLSPQNHSPISVTPGKSKAASQPRPTVDRNPRNPVQREVQPVRDIQPQIIVSPEEQIILARYAQQWRRQKHAPLLAENAENSSVAPLQVTPIQIAKLDVKLLAEEKSQ